jgi:hypothetical protein
LPSICAIIRTAEVDARARRLAGELAPAFGEDIYFVVDRYGDADAPELLVKAKAIFVGRKFLDRRGLPWFARVGWQCGDFVYYAAAAVLSHFDYYFVVEDDVSFRCDGRSFFAPLLQMDFDLALHGVHEAAGVWQWTRTMAGFYDIPAQQTFFPLSCVSRRAAEYLLQERIRYSRQTPDAPVIPANYANDEAFVATAARHGGFRVTDLATLFPASAWRRFSLNLPIHPDELGFFSDAVLHPVCTGRRARDRFDWLVSDFSASRARLDERRKEFSRHLGPELWQEFSGIEASFFEQDETGPAAQIYHLQTLVMDRLPGRTGTTCQTRIFQRRLVVFDFATDAGTIAFDVALAPESSAYTVDAFGREISAIVSVARLNGGKVPNGKLRICEVPADLAPAARADAIADAIAGAISTLRA